MKRFPSRTSRLLVPLTPLVLAAAVMAPATIYTKEQAQRGSETFEVSCAICHSSSEFEGQTFQRIWGRQSVASLHAYLTATMPEDDPGNLEPQQYADLVAYILEMNDHPPGDEELPADPSALTEALIGR